MPNAICKEHRDKLYSAITEMVKTENPYQPLSDRTLVLMLNDRELWSTQWMIQMIRKEHSFPSAPNRRRQYDKRQR